MHLRIGECPSAPEHQTSNSENTPESPVKSILYAEVDKNSLARSMIGLPITSNSTMNSINVKMAASKRNRHRRIGSGDSNRIHLTSSEAKTVKMVHIETQTENLDVNLLPKNAIRSFVNRELSASLSNIRLSTATRLSNGNSAQDLRVHLKEIPGRLQTRNHSTTAISSTNNNDKSCSTDSIDGKGVVTTSDERLDCINSNEQLEMRESSDEDNLEKLGRRVSQFFNENGLLCENNGNPSTSIDRRALFNIMASKRSCIAINKDQVTVISRGTGTAKNSPNVYQFSRTEHKRTKPRDHNCNNEDGDDEGDYSENWTDDEEAEDSDNNYTSLRRKRFVLECCALVL